MVEIIFQGKPVAKGKVEYPPNGKKWETKKGHPSGWPFPKVQLLSAEFSLSHSKLLPNKRRKNHLLQILQFHSSMRIFVAP